MPVESRQGLSAPATIEAKMQTQGDDEHVAVATRIVDDNLYMVLGTVDGTGGPWVAPV
jgi:hypothetical protein